MTTTAAGQWLVELLGLLGRLGELDDADEEALDALLEVGLSLSFTPEDIAGFQADDIEAAVAMLGAAKAIAAEELSAVHRQRIDVDRTVRAITAYVRALS